MRKVGKNNSQPKRRKTELKNELEFFYQGIFKIHKNHFREEARENDCAQSSQPKRKYENSFSKIK
jgi:hypothetical protein